MPAAYTLPAQRIMKRKITINNKPSIYTLPAYEFFFRFHYYYMRAYNITYRKYMRVLVNHLYPQYLHK